MGAGAMGHMETSLFEQCGYSREAIQARLERNWYEMFEGPDKIYWENDEGLGYVMDTGNHDVRTEGMSYAMMIAVQYGRKDVFDKLWGWVMKYMFMTEGLHQGYFAWSVDPSGVPNADGPAPDGEEYFAMDLFLASARWGDGEGVYEYSRHVRSILHTCVHQGEDGEGYPMWNPENHLIKFIPETEWTDPSYHLPHFYEVFAERADETDRPFWAQAAKASREYLVTACHPQTGMNPEYSNYDGTPHVDERDHWHFYSDAYRTAGNIGLDCLWNGVVPELCDANARLQRFFLEHDRTCVYAVDGTPVDETVLHPVGFIAATAEGSLAAMHSQEPDALDNAIRWVRLLWDTPIRTGTRRYYDNFLYAFAFLALAGEYRTW